MSFIDRMVERFIRLNRRLKKWQRVVSVLAAIVVFATTYALILPAITLDQDTASVQAGIEIAESADASEDADAADESGEGEEAEEAAEPEEAVEPETEEPAKEDDGSENDAAEAEEDPAPAASETSDAVNEDTENDTDEGEYEDPLQVEGQAGEDEAGVDQTAVPEEGADTAELAVDPALAAEETPAEQPVLITEDTQLVFTGNDYTVYADFGESAQFPVGVELSVREITKESDPEAYEAYCGKALSEVQDKYAGNTQLSFARFYDITFLYEGKEIEPSGDVKVRIEYTEAVEIAKETAVDTIHFDKKDEENPTVIDSEIDSEKKGSDEAVKAVEFASDQFSVYGIVGTETFTAQYLSAKGNLYEVMVDCDADARIPDGSRLVITEFDENSEEYSRAKTLLSGESLSVLQSGDNELKEDGGRQGDTMRVTADDLPNEGDVAPDTVELPASEPVGDTEELELLDISIVDSEGNSIEPSDRVRVSIVRCEVPGEIDEESFLSTAAVRHFNESSGETVVETVADAAGLCEGTVSINEGKVTAEFAIDSFSTFAVTWGTGNANRVTVHHGVIENGSFTEFGTNGLPSSSNSVYPSGNLTASNYNQGYAYLIYDFDGYTYSETRLRTLSGTDITPRIYSSGSYWYYSTTSAPNTYTGDNNRRMVNGDNIYVIYTKDTEPTSGYVPPSGDGGDPDEPQQEDSELEVTKNVTSNHNGTYGVTLTVEGDRKETVDVKKANVIVIFDTSNSMKTNYVQVGNQSQTRLRVAKTAVNTLADLLIGTNAPKDKNGNKLVQMALIAFDNTASSRITGGYTDDYTAYTGVVNGLDTSQGHATNWEDALRTANIMAVSGDAPTYVVFVTDGDPTLRLSRGNYTDAQLTSNSDFNSSYGINLFGAGRLNDNNYVRCYEQTLDEGRSIVSHNKVFYTIGFSSDVERLSDLTAHAYQGTSVDPDDRYIPAQNLDDLTAAFEKIASAVSDSVGFTNVSVTDGVTALTTVSTKLAGGTVDEATYEIWYQVVQGEDGKWSYTDAEGNVHDMGAGTPSGENVKTTGSGETLRYYYATDWSDPIEASINENTNAVTWDLSSLGMLPDKTMYRVTLTIWPSQKSYDIVADINNGVIRSPDGTVTKTTPAAAYAAQPAEVREQIDESGGIYYLKTNTTLTADYTYAGSDITGKTYTYENGAMNLDAEPISLKKNWPANMLDNYGAATYRDENGEEHTATEIDLTVTRDESEFLDVSVGAPTWQENNIFVSCGLMTITDGVIDIKETGYDYTVIEPSGFSYYWDLYAEIYHPMVINGVSTLLALDESASSADNINSFELNGKIYKTVSTGSATLEADNYRRSNLNLTKVVTSENAPEDSWFTYTVTVTDADSTDGYVWFSAYDPTIPWTDPDGTTGSGDTVKDWSVTGASKEIKDGEETGYWYAPNGGEVTFKIKAGWNVRFLNLKHDSTFAFEETDPGEGFSFVTSTASTKYEMSDPDWYSGGGTTAVSGTIKEPNNSYTVTYSNKWDTIDILLKKVDENGNEKSGAVFDLNRYESSWTGIRSGIKPGDAESSTPNPVDLGGLGVGRYRLTETQPPAGYVILSNHVYFEVYKEGTDLKARLTDESGNAIESPTEITQITGPGTGETPTYTITVTNTPGTALPNTGGSGTFFYTLGGLMLVVASALMCVFRMRRRERRFM